jgi:hypothetical protein
MLRPAFVVPAGRRFAPAGADTPPYRERMGDPGVGWISCVGHPPPSRVASYVHGQGCFHGVARVCGSVCGWVLSEQYRLASAAYCGCDGGGEAGCWRDCSWCCRRAYEEGARGHAASATELQRLPGVTPEVAGRIVEHRPYTSTRDLVRKRVLSSEEFDRVKGQIVVK